MQRFKLTIEYDGTPYAGWQRQQHSPSVQAAIEQAIFKFAQEEVTLLTAGRTDAGVHARAQVAHFDLAKDRNEYEVCEGINYYLRKHPIIVLSAEKVSDDFHSRFTAKARHYRYDIICRRAPLALDANRAWHLTWSLDVEAMQDAAQILLGKHDFSSFRDTHCQSKSPIKTLDRLEVKTRKDRVMIYAEAQSFLHHQVRIMVGSLSWVGSGKWSKADLQNALDAKDRRAGGLTAPACGLYLTKVVY